jgi:hypothetical protein
MSLQSALQSLREAIPKGDWELATRCCKRAMDVRRDVLESPFSARVIVCPEPIAPHTITDSLPHPSADVLGPFASSAGFANASGQAP